MSNHDHVDQIGEIGKEIHIRFDLAYCFAVRCFCETKQDYALYDFGIYNSSENGVIYFKICLVGCHFGSCNAKAIRIMKEEYDIANQKEHVNL